MHSSVRRRQHAARSNIRYHCVPPGGDGLRQWENQRILSIVGGINPPIAPLARPWQRRRGAGCGVCRHSNGSAPDHHHHHRPDGCFRRATRR